jgi:uncharacterized protein (TIGR00269 family)
MKCRKCGQKAVLNMRQHKLALCKDHYLAWIPEQTERFIEKYAMFEKQDRVLVAVSGGKDSLVLWDVLMRLGYQAEGLYIGLGIEGQAGYSDNSHRYAAAFAADSGGQLHTVDVEVEFGATIPEVAALSQRGRGKPCSVCGLSKRHIMNRVAREGNYNVLVTGHNLDDEAATLFGNTLNWSTGYLARQGPVLPASAGGFVRKAKPFFRFYERETAAYALLRGIEYIYEECPHAQGAKSIYYKELLNQLEADRPGAKLAFYLSFLRAKESGLFKIESEPAAMRTCDRCGQPTTAPDYCAFCRTWERVREQALLAE